MICLRREHIDAVLFYFTIFVTNNYLHYLTVRKVPVVIQIGIKVYTLK